MPEMSGVEVMKEIRKLDKKVGIIMATALVDQDVVDEAIKMGASDYIIKPFDLEYLRKSVLTKLASLT
jgi:two-component system NtrC family response regulator